jgi:hypothetical protein
LPVSGALSLQQTISASFGKRRDHCSFLGSDITVLKLKDGLFLAPVVEDFLALFYRLKEAESRLGR